MKIDKFIALVLVVIFGIYSLLAYNYPLLPFEEGLVFKPNTFPIGIGLTGFILSLLFLVVPSASSDSNDASSDKKEDELSQTPESNRKKFDLRTTVTLTALMLVYSFLLKPLGFVLSTTLFLICSSLVMGEKKYWLLISISFFCSFALWYLVDKVLGIYMNAIPFFLQ